MVAHLVDGRAPLGTLLLVRHLSHIQRGLTQGQASVVAPPAPHSPSHPFRVCVYACACTCAQGVHLTPRQLHRLNLPD
eukprot:3992553-Prymnesium_polylepis.1